MEVMECLLIFCVESIACQFVVQKYEDYDLQNLILPVVLYGCETLLTLKEECRLRALRIFGSKRYEVTGDWKRLHYEKLYNLYFSPNIFELSNKEE